MTTLSDVTTVEPEVTEDPRLVSCLQETEEAKLAIAKLKNENKSLANGVEILENELKVRNQTIKSLENEMEEKEKKFIKDLTNEKERHETEMKKEIKRWEGILKGERDRFDDHDKKVKKEREEERVKWLDQLQKKEEDFRSLKGNKSIRVIINC